MTITTVVGASFVNTSIFIPPVSVPFLFYLIPEVSFTRIINRLAIGCYYDRCYSQWSDFDKELTALFLILFIFPTIYGIIGILIDLEFFKRERKVKNSSGQYIRLGKEAQVRKTNVEMIINNLTCNKYSLVVSNIVKTYQLGGGKTVEALKGVSFFVKKGEIFGLLGPNGAGKTTLLSILTGSILQDRGSAYIEGLNIENQKNEIFKQIGVCPQFDCLWPELTIEDHFLFYIRIRGVDRKLEKFFLNEVVSQMKLEEHRKKKVSELSGGMKRRVSIGIAVCGDTRLVFLDEPTSGLDPINRIQIWHILNDLKTKKSIILTTHLMDEADQLCDRIGIINLGSIVCLDHQANLKNRYGSGFIFYVIFEENKEISIDDFMVFMLAFDSKTEIIAKEKNSLSLRFGIDKERLVEFFGKLKANQERLGVFSWSFSQSSLKDVFVKAVEESEQKFGN